MKNGCCLNLKAGDVTNLEFAILNEFPRIALLKSFNSKIRILKIIINLVSIIILEFQQLSHSKLVWILFLFLLKVQSIDYTIQGEITLILKLVKQLAQKKEYYSNLSLKLSTEYFIFQYPSKEGFLMFQLAPWYTKESWSQLEAVSYIQSFTQIFLIVSLIHFLFLSISLLRLCEFHWNDSLLLLRHFLAMH